MKQTTPKDLAKKRAEEQLLVSEMIALYCRRQHRTPKGLALPGMSGASRLCAGPHRPLPVHGDEDLLFGLQSPLLQACHAGADPHCHALGRPRMLPVHPVLSIRHVIVTIRAKRKAGAEK